MPYYRRLIIQNLIIFHEVPDELQLGIPPKWVFWERYDMRVSILAQTSQVFALQKIVYKSYPHKDTACHNLGKSQRFQWGENLGGLIMSRSVTCTQLLTVISTPWHPCLIDDAINLGPDSRQLFLVHTCLAERYLNVLRSRHAVGRKMHATNQQVWSAQGCWHACQEPSKEAKTCVEGDIREGVGAGRCQRRRECRWWRLISACCHTFPGVSQGLVLVTSGAATLFLNVNNLDTMIFLINLPRHRYDLS